MTAHDIKCALPDSSIPVMVWVDVGGMWVLKPIFVVDITKNFVAITLDEEQHTIQNSRD